MSDIQRICMLAKPSASNLEFFEWQMASVCLFVPENDKQAAVARAREELTRRHWEFINYQDKSTLIEERVREQGGEVWDAFQYARSGRIFLKVFPQHFGAGDPQFQWMRPARITEAFIDQVVVDAGGRRLSKDERGNGEKNADYLIGRFVFELKDIQEEAIRKRGHQERVATLFAPYFPGQDQVPIDPSVLSKPDFQRYLDILGKPIQRAVKSASKQIRETRMRLGDETLNGGIIVLNTGFGSFPHEAFAEQVERYAVKDSSQITVAVSIDTWSYTNGFDSYVFSAFSPTEPRQEEVVALRESFDKHFEEMMTDLVTGRLPSSTELSDPAKPTSFECNGIDLCWQPPQVPLPWKQAT